jgi:hypothetical protein
MSIEDRLRSMSMAQFIVASYVITGAIVTVGLAFKK